jgi:hypothetical protein
VFHVPGGIEIHFSFLCYLCKTYTGNDSVVVSPVMLYDVDILYIHIYICVCVCDLNFL